MKHYPQAFGIELSNNKLFVFDTSRPTERIEVDQIVFEALPTDIQGNVAIGVIRSIHGLPMETAHVLPPRVLRDLVGGNSLPTLRTQRGTPRWRAVAGETKFKRVSMS